MPQRESIIQLFQQEISLGRHSPGLYNITSHINQCIESSYPKISGGMAHLFLKHTSASLTINENTDQDVLKDLSGFMNRLVKNESYFKHTAEGPDDMPAHIKSSLLGATLNVPIQNFALNLGTWQGVFLFEHRLNKPERKLVVTLLGTS